MPDSDHRDNACLDTRACSETDPLGLGGSGSPVRRLKQLHPGEGEGELLGSLPFVHSDKSRDLQPRSHVPQYGEPVLKKLRFKHHQLAQLLARGTSNIDASLITGYRPEYISRLQATDPAFKELLDHYRVQQDIRFVDVVERLQALGIASIEELQERIDTDPGAMSNRELMELADLTLIRPAKSPAAAGAGATASGSPINIAVNFVTAKHKALIDVTPSEGEEE